MPKTFLASGVGPPGKYNLHGKKSGTAVCGCCDIFDFRESYNASLAKKEMRAASIKNLAEEMKDK